MAEVEAERTGLGERKLSCALIGAGAKIGFDLGNPAGVEDGPKRVEAAGFEACKNRAGRMGDLDGLLDLSLERDVAADLTGGVGAAGGIRGD